MRLQGREEAGRKAGWGGWGWLGPLGILGGEGRPEEGSRGIRCPKVLLTSPKGGQNRLGLPQPQITARGAPRPVPRGCLDEEPRKDRQFSQLELQPGAKRPDGSGAGGEAGSQTYAGLPHLLLVLPLASSRAQTPLLKGTPSLLGVRPLKRKMERATGCQLWIQNGD